MHTMGVQLYGAPCDGKAYIIQYDGPPPITQTCKGMTYHLYPTNRSDLVYVTSQWTADHEGVGSLRGQRDVFQAWHRLMHALDVRVAGERRRIHGARQRIKRAVR